MKEAKIPRPKKPGAAGSRMNPEIKALWLEALRSGKYKQGRGHLYNKRTLRRKSGEVKAKEIKEYCCLGVLCDIHRKVTGTGKWLNGCYLKAEVLLPREVVEWAGMPSRKIIDNSYEEFDLIVGTIGSSQNASLASINDDSNNFEDVIKTIEKKL